MAACRPSQKELPVKPETVLQSLAARGPSSPEASSGIGEALAGAFAAAGATIGINHIGERDGPPAGRGDVDAMVHGFVELFRGSIKYPNWRNRAERSMKSGQRLGRPAGSFHAASGTACTPLAEAGLLERKKRSRRLARKASQD